MVTEYGDIKSELSVEEMIRKMNQSWTLQTEYNNDGTLM